MENDDILDGLDEILGGAAEMSAPAPPPPPAPAQMKRTRRTKAEMAAAAAVQGAEVMGALAAAVMVVKPASAAPPADPMALQHGFSGRKLRVIIDKGHNKDDPTTAFLRLNGYEATVQRGVPVDLYEEVIAACLDGAVQTVYAQPSDGVLVPHESLRFPYRVIR